MHYCISEREGEIACCWLMKYFCSELFVLKWIWHFSRLFYSGLILGILCVVTAGWFLRLWLFCLKVVIYLETGPHFLGTLHSRVFLQQVILNVGRMWPSFLFSSGSAVSEFRVFLFRSYYCKGSSLCLPPL